MENQSVLGGKVYKEALVNGYPKDGIFVGFPGPNEGKMNTQLYPDFYIYI
jgi:hypothetical protein